MAHVSVPRDLTKVKTKIAMGLTKRQLICFSIATVIGLPIFFITRGAIGNSPAVMLMIVAMCPLFFFAMYERDGQPAEKVVTNIIKWKYFPHARPYKTENLYQIIQREVDKIGTEASEQREKKQKDNTAKNKH